MMRHLICSRGGVRSQCSFPEKCARARSCLAFYVPEQSCVPRVPLRVKTESRDLTGMYDFEGRICDEAAPLGSTPKQLDSASKCSLQFPCAQEGEREKSRTFCWVICVTPTPGTPPPQMPWVIETSLLCLCPRWDVIGMYQLLLMKLGVQVRSSLALRGTPTWGSTPPFLIKCMLVMIPDFRSPQNSRGLCRLQISLALPRGKLFAWESGGTLVGDFTYNAVRQICKILLTLCFLHQRINPVAGKVELPITAVSRCE